MLHVFPVWGTRRVPPDRARLLPRISRDTLFNSLSSFTPCV